MALPPEDPPPGVPEWLVTFGDMMSLLLCFFILLFAFSDPKSDERMMRIIESMMSRFADEETLAQFLAQMDVKRSAQDFAVTVKTRQPGAAVLRPGDTSAKGRRGRQAKVETIRDGRRLTVGGPLLFEPGVAVILPDAKRGLLEIADALRGKGHMIEVKGYASPTPLPPGSPFTQPVDLAYARTRAVTELLTTEGRLAPEMIRMSIAAPIEAATLPRHESGETMAERVDILILESTGRDFGHGGLPPQP